MHTDGSVDLQAVNIRKTCFTTSTFRRGG